MYQTLPSKKTASKPKSTVIQRCRDTDRKFAAAVNRMTKSLIPFHTNQYEPNAPESRIRGALSRYLVHGRLHISGNTTDLSEIAILARSAEAFGAGVCNDNSASALFTIIRNEASVPSFPVIRAWNKDMKHSYIIMGDPRLADPIVIDPWWNKMDPSLVSQYSGHIDENFSIPYCQSSFPPLCCPNSTSFAPRMEHEFARLAHEYTVSADSRLLHEYERIPQKRTLSSHSHLYREHESNPQKTLTKEEIITFARQQHQAPSSPVPYYPNSNRFHYYIRQPFIDTTYPLQELPDLKKPLKPALFDRIERELNEFNTAGLPVELSPRSSTVFDTPAHTAISGTVLPTGLPPLIW